MKEWAQLVEKAKKGDLGAFDSLVVKFRDMAVGYAYSILKDFHLAEDAAQEAFIQAFRDIHMLKEPYAFPAWFRKIVFKFCDRIKRKKTPATVDIEHAAELPAKNPGSKDSEETVLECIESLPENERAVTTLFYINGYSMAEVGSFLEVPVSTVKSRLFAARKQIKQRMVNMVKETMHNHGQDDAFNRRIRDVLEKVPVISFELHRQKQKDKIPRCPESVPFPSCVRAFLEYTGQGDESSIIEAHGRKWRLDNTYVTTMGTSGAVFKLNWKPGFHHDNCLISYISDDPWKPQKNALEALGISYKIIEKDGKNRDRMTARIKESIQKHGRALIAQGVVGPPEECLITGFDKDGEILLGWSFFQRMKEFSADVEFEPSGYFRKRNWYPDIKAIILLGERKKNPDPKVLYRKALAWAIPVMEQAAPCPGIPNGISAYDAWIDTIRDDAAFTNRKVKELQSQYEIHHSNVGLLAECRWYGHLFLDRMLAETGPNDDVKTASGCFIDIHDLMWKVWGAAGGLGVAPAKAKRFADPAVRKEVIGLLEKARDMDRKALEYLKKASI